MFIKMFVHFRNKPSFASGESNMIYESDEWILALLLSKGSLIKITMTNCN